MKNVRIPAENVGSFELANRRLQPLGHSSLKIKYLYGADLAILTFRASCRMEQVYIGQAPNLSVNTKEVFDSPINNQK